MNVITKCNNNYTKALYFLEKSATLYFFSFQWKRNFAGSLETCINDFNYLVFNVTIILIFLVAQRFYNNLITYKNHTKLRKAALNVWKIITLVFYSGSIFPKPIPEISYTTFKLWHLFFIKSIHILKVCLFYLWA